MTETSNFSSKYTNSFNEILQKAGISVLVSTYQAGKLILLRANSTLNTHFVSIVKPMGMAFSGSRLSVGTANQVWDYFNMQAVAAKIQPVNKHDACFIPRRLHITGDIDIHEMAFDKENTLWLINTRMSALCTLDLNYSVVPEWRPPFVDAYDLSDRCHLNGLAMKNGKPVYVTALGKTNTPAGWRKNKATGGILMNIETNEILCQGLSMPHSPRWYQDKLYVLESGAGKICTINPENGEKTTIAEVPGFCRGIAFLGPYAFIGLSQVRETAVFAGLPLTKRFPERHCGIWIIDLRNGNTVGMLQFDAGVQEIFAVEILSCKYPAILDINDPFVSTSYSLPDKALNELAEIDPLESELGAATLLRREGKLEEAVERFTSILEKFPNENRVLYILGDTLAVLGRWEEAVDILKQFIKNDPENADANFILGNCLTELNNYELAIKYLDNAIKSDQGYSAAHQLKGNLLLRLNQFNEGWTEYVWKRKMPDFHTFNSSKPIWDGNPVTDKKLLIHTEGNIEDTLALARLLPKISTLCKELIIAVPIELYELMKKLKGVSRVKLSGNISDKDFDIYCPILNLPLLKNVFDTCNYNSGEKIPYFKTPENIKTFSINKENSNLKIGFIWENDKKFLKELDVESLLQLSDVNGIELFCFISSSNDNIQSKFDEKGIVNLSQYTSSFADMAGVINQLDLIITNNSLVAHLSGALNKPAWVIVSGNAHWSWSVSNNSDWYPSVRIFRKTVSETWNYLLDTVKDELEKYSDI